MIDPRYHAGEQAEEEPKEERCMLGTKDREDAA